MKTQITITCELLPVTHPDLSYLEQDYNDCEPSDAENYRARDANRLKEYGNSWHMVGVVAKAQILTPAGNGDRIISEMQSPGLWGVESDSGEAYFNEIFEEEKAMLLDMISKLADFEIVDE